MILVWLAACALDRHDARVAELEAEVAELRAEVELMVASSPSNRPPLVRRGCLTHGAVAEAHVFQSFEPLTGDDGALLGLQPKRVPKNSLWEVAGLRKDDLLVAIAGLEVSDQKGTAAAVRAIEELGTDPIRMEVLRDGERVPLAVDPWCR